jgi:hypothetical protein
LRALRKYSNKISKAAKPVKLVFRTNNMAKALLLLDKYHLSIHTSEGAAVKYDYQRLISNPCFLLYVYGSLKPKASGIDQISIENVTLGGILTLANSLRKDTYKPKPARWINIPKANGGVRPLGIASGRDKIIQKACHLLIEPVFEPKFRNSSHGFRKNRSCHSALMQMDKK